MKYDEASWHYGGDFPADLPASAGATHIGLFLAWMLIKGFASEELADDAAQVNPNGGAIALGHPLGMSGARLVLTALHQLEKTGGKKGLATMCVGVGQGLALAIERV